MLRDQETKKGYLKLKRFIRLSVNELVIRYLKKKLFVIIVSLPNQKPPPIYYDIHPTYVLHVRCYPGDCGEPEIGR